MQIVVLSKCDLRKRKEMPLFACYLLTSIHPEHPLSTYVGFTVNPFRRIRQHNGEITNGAWRTKKKRPWKMVRISFTLLWSHAFKVLLIHGFPTKVDALRFEWAWQHPKESLSVRQIMTGLKGIGHLSKLKAKLRIAHEVSHRFVGH